MVDAVAEHSGHAVERLDPQRGSMLAAVWLRQPDGPERAHVGRPRTCAGPGVVAGSCWGSSTPRGTRSIGSGSRAPSEHTSYRRWSALHDRAAELDTRDYWVAQLDGADPGARTRRVRPQTTGSATSSSRCRSRDTRCDRRVCSVGPSRLRTYCRRRSADDRSVAGAPGTGSPPPLLALETHGRADGIMGDTDTSDTVGLLTAIYPLRIDVARRDRRDAGLWHRLRAAALCAPRHCAALAGLCRTTGVAELPRQGARRHRR